MNASDGRTERTTRPGETAQPPAGLGPSIRHFLGNRTARTVVLIAVVLVVLLAIGLALSVGSTTEDEPGPGAGTAGTAVAHVTAVVRAA